MSWGLLLALCGGLLAPTVAGGRHSLAVLVTIVIEEDWAHHYFMIAQLDDIKILYYSSDTREVRTTKEWAAQALGAEFFQNKTQEFWTYDEDSKGGMRRLMQQHNQTGGVHTEQIHVGCALSNQAPVDPRFQYAYDGGDFISFDNQTGTWVAAVQPAFLQKQLWETGKTWTQYVQWCLQHECMGTLRILLQQGMGVLEQQAPGMWLTHTVSLQCPPSSQLSAETPLTAPSPSPAMPGAFTRVPSTSPGCGTEKTSWRRWTPAGSCPMLTAPTTGSRPWRSPHNRRTGTAMPAGWSTAACRCPRSSGVRVSPWEEGHPASWGCGRHRPGSGWSRRGQRHPVEEKISRPLCSGSQ
ncbi:class I histocompatibility antigen, F10 alpha chain-like isoform X1 [Emys orbicularis]|uniref:class I histocompatibility antigen, F10 alpha chain-like isoform X1 n=1 Tax=Emys orbicularis TaxID=82168 RepID=UPI0031FDB2CC